MENYKTQIRNNNKIKKNEILKLLQNKKDSKKIANKTSKYFNIKTGLSNHLVQQFENSQFLIEDQPWGENSFRKDIYYYLDFYDEFNNKNFKKKVFDLLKNSKNKTPQSGKNRDIKHYRSGGDFEEDLPGKKIEYSAKHNSEYKHQFTFCNKTNVDFFKGSNDDVKQINKLGYGKLFSYAFLYGYLDSAINIIFKIGFLDSAFFDPLHIPSKKPKLIISKLNDKNYDNKYVKNIKIEFLKKFYKFSQSKSEEIINNIEKSIFESKLSEFLLIKKENYFTHQKINITDYKSKDGTADFLSKIKRQDEDEFKYIKDKRINKIMNFTQTKQNIPKGIFYYGNDGSNILNFEQFRFYTLHTPYLETYNSKDLNIDEQDIFIRYAIYMGIQEFQFYSHHKIFGGF